MLFGILLDVHSLGFLSLQAIRPTASPPSERGPDEGTTPWRGSQRGFKVGSIFYFIFLTRASSEDPFWTSRLDGMPQLAYLG